MIAALLGAEEFAFGKSLLIAPAASWLVFMKQTNAQRDYNRPQISQQVSRVIHWCSFIERLPGCSGEPRKIGVSLGDVVGKASIPVVSARYEEPD